MEETREKYMLLLMCIITHYAGLPFLNLCEKADEKENYKKTEDYLNLLDETFEKMAAENLSEESLKQLCDWLTEDMHIMKDSISSELTPGQLNCLNKVLDKYERHKEILLKL